MVRDGLHVLRPQRNSKLWSIAQSLLRKGTRASCSAANADSTGTRSLPAVISVLCLLKSLGLTERFSFMLCVYTLRWWCCSPAACFYSRLLLLLLKRNQTLGKRCIRDRETDLLRSKYHGTSSAPTLAAANASRRNVSPCCCNWHRSSVYRRHACRNRGAACSGYPKHCCTQHKTSTSVGARQMRSFTFTLCTMSHCNDTRSPSG